ncbi:MAG: hypothetical protein OXG26_14930 [Caldilineaceae bacterium]|nr:hypothetical protein [Caldilineaceae bacterium]
MSSDNPVHEAKIDETVDATLSAVSQRRMVLPAILFLAGHRPLAFTFGQLLLILQPLAVLLGSEGLDAWVRVLTHPSGPPALTDRLAQLLEEDRHSGHEVKTGT